ncbi:hypothetical protein F5Y09DRAFT_304930 [Xylaria sp. FL1042]|nr:hypothetical protein F5Y09DRAFT_304930 [Xylaria sp. FL1042]
MWPFAAPYWIIIGCLLYDTIVSWVWLSRGLVLDEKRMAFGVSRLKQRASIPVPVKPSELHNCHGPFLGLSGFACHRQFNQYAQVYFIGFCDRHNDSPK